MSCRFVHFGGRPRLLPRGSSGSSTASLLALAREIQDGVQRAFGVRLDIEPVLVA